MPALARVPVRLSEWLGIRVFSLTPDALGDEGRYSADIALKLEVKDDDDAEQELEGPT